MSSRLGMQNPSSWLAESIVSPDPAQILRLCCSLASTDNLKFTSQARSTWLPSFLEMLWGRHGTHNSAPTAFRYNKMIVSEGACAQCRRVHGARPLSHGGVGCNCLFDSGLLRKAAEACKKLLCHDWQADMAAGRNVLLMASRGAGKSALIRSIREETWQPGRIAALQVPTTLLTCA